MRYDTIIIGVGSMGSSACYQLAKRGRKVLGLEQFNLVHEQGSHTGQSRLIRQAYFEHPDYVPLLFSAYRGWAEIEQAGGTQLYWPTGIAYFGEPEDEIMLGIKASARKFDLRLKSLALDAYEEFRIPGNYEGLLEPEAGFLSPERAIGTLVKLAKKHGAEIRENTPVRSWRMDGNEVVVETENESFRAGNLIISAGAFVSEIAELPAEMKKTRQYLAWADTDKFQMGQVPCWFIADRERPGSFYGFPSNNGLEGPTGLKLACHRPGEALTDPENFDHERELLEGFMEKFFTSKMNIHTHKTCKYTYSPDEHFIIDWLPEHRQKVLIATGFSGHGFKFVPVVGEILADLATAGTTDHPINFLSLGRF